MKIGITLAVLLLMAGPALAGSIGFTLNRSCTVTDNVVTCVPSPGRGSLIVEASNSDFVDLRDELAANHWQNSDPTLCGAVGQQGCLTCTDCMVAQSVPGCVAPGVQVATTIGKAALAQLSCVLRSFVIQKRVREVVPPPIPEPDIGGGDPEG